MVVAADGTGYGLHGGHDLAELVRARGWLTAPPADGTLLLRLVDAAYFEGVGSTTLRDPGMVVEETGITVYFDQFTPPGPEFPWHAVLPASGNTQLFTVDNTGHPDGSGFTSALPDERLRTSAEHI